MTREEAIEKAIKIILFFPADKREFLDPEFRNTPWGAACFDEIRCLFHRFMDNHHV